MPTGAAGPTHGVGITTRATSEATIEAALNYAARGWRVFPLVPGTKRPAVRRWQDRATVDPARIERCWATLTPAGPYGVGIACGPSQLLVVDLDRPKPGHTMPADWQAVPGVVDGADVLAVLAERAGAPDPALSGTYAVSTPTTGQHLYFAAPVVDEAPSAPQPLGNTAGCLGPLVDTRGAGGYVVAPPTALTGDTDKPGAYVVDDATAPVLAPPAWLVEALRPRDPNALATGAASVVRLATAPTATAGAGDADRAARYAQAALDRTLAQLLEAAPGTRNRTLYGAAVSLGRLVAGNALDDAETRAALGAAAGAIGLDAREATATIRSGMRAGAQHPRTIPTAHDSTTALQTAPTTAPNRSTPGAAA